MSLSPSGVWERMRSARAVARVLSNGRSKPAVADARQIGAFEGDGNHQRRATRGSEGLLEKLDANHVVMTSGEVDEYEAELKEKIDAREATAAFDVVAGEMIGHLVAVMLSKGGVHVYGATGSNASNINLSDLIYREKRLEGFFLLMTWLWEGGPAAMMGRIATEGKVMNKGLSSLDGWACTIFKDTAMEKAHEDLVEQLKGSNTGQKLRILSDGSEDGCVGMNGKGRD